MILIVSMKICVILSLSALEFLPLLPLLLNLINIVANWPKIQAMNQLLLVLIGHHLGILTQIVCQHTLGLIQLNLQSLLEMVLILINWPRRHQLKSKCLFYRNHFLNSLIHWFVISFIYFQPSFKIFWKMEHQVSLQSTDSDWESTKWWGWSQKIFSIRWLYKIKSTKFAFKNLFE